MPGLPQRRGWGTAGLFWDLKRRFETICRFQLSCLSWLRSKHLFLDEAQVQLCRLFSVSRQYNVYTQLEGETGTKLACWLKRFLPAQQG